MKFSEVITTRRKALRISQDVMAGLLIPRVSLSCYQKWEQGKRTPNPIIQRHHLERISFIEAQQARREEIPLTQD